MSTTTLERADPGQLRREMVRRLIEVPLTVRVWSLTLWPLLYAVYWGSAPLWMVAAPAVLHAACNLAFFVLGQAWRRDPARLSIQRWRLLLVVVALFNGIAYGLGGGLLVTLPFPEERLAICLIICITAIAAPSRPLDGAVFNAYAGATLVCLSAGLISIGERGLIVLAAAATILYWGLLAAMARGEQRRARLQFATELHNAELTERHEAALAETRRALDEAQASRQTLETIVDAMSDGVALVDANDRFVLVNDAILRFHNVDRSTFDAKPSLREVFEFQAERGDWGPIDATEREAEIERRLTGFRDGTDWQLIQREGRSIQIAVKVLPDGRRVSMQRDVTELQNAREAAETAGQAMQTVLDEMPDATLLYEADGRWAFVNEPLVKLHGISREMLQKLPDAWAILDFQIARGDFGPLDDKQKAEIVAVRRRMFETGSDGWILVRRGDKRLQFSLKVLRDGRRLVMHRDVTELEEARESAEAARDEANEARQRLLLAMEAMVDGIAFLDADERLLQCNEAYRGFMGHQPGIITPGTSLVDGAAHAAKAGAAPPGRADTWVAEQVATLRRGEPALISYAPQRWARVLMRGADDDRKVVLVTDVSQERRRQRELEKALGSAEKSRAEAEAANQAKSTFLATMSHEIRTPMNGVLGMMDVLEAQGLGEAQRGTVATMRESATALLRIIDELLDFSKIEAGALDLEEVPFSLSGIVDGTVATFRPQASRKGLSLVAAVAPGSADSLLGDPTRVRQILFNLLGNALKFTERGGAMVKARTEPLGDGRTRVSLSIEDTGVGMSPAQMARLFQPFAQADSSTTRRYGGTGLGLSIVRRLAQAMGGDVAADSRPGMGSTFTVTLELRAAPADSLHSAPSAGDASAGPAPSPTGLASARVLVVDDHPVNRDVLQGQLRALGVEADTAVDGREGLAAWRRGDYAIVFADVHMPDMDGFEMTARMRIAEAEGSRQRTPIVAVTANAMRGEDERCRAAGMDAYLAKPVALDSLRVTLQRWLPANKTPRSLPVATATTEAGSPILDRSILSAWMGDDHVAIRALFDSFLTTAREVHEEIERAMACGDLASIAAAAHKLKGAALAVGARRIADVALRLESAGKAADRASCRDALGPLAAETRLVAAEIESAPAA
ncbi:MAG: PAS-domain containing protein [Alphaproteobacteria bacterium]|nr:PAS-domain containing protein [Alphaproteobacteria bacterium]MCW5743403.1 PAS-domain containing protein [Alphaproteobacteria bacterium]